MYVYEVEMKREKVEKIRWIKGFIVINENEKEEGKRVLSKMGKRLKVLYKGKVKGSKTNKERREKKIRY